MRIAILFVLSLALLTGCGSSESEHPPALAKVNGRPITAAEVGAPSSPSPGAAQDALERAIDLRLVADEARRRGLAASTPPQGMQRNEEERLRDALFATLRDSQAPSEAELRAHYAKTQARFVARQVVLRRKALASEAEVRALERRLGTSGRLEATFADTIGPAPREALPSTVLPEALSLTSVGQRVAVQREGQWFLVELEEIRSAEPLPFEAVRPKVEESLRLLRAQAEYHAELERLRREAKIEVDASAFSR